MYFKGVLCSGIHCADLQQKNKQDNSHATFPAVPDHGKHDAASDCAYTPRALEKTFIFPDPETFSLHELINKGNLISGGVSGTIRVVRGEAYQQENIQVRLSFRANEDFAAEQIRYAVTDSSLSIEVPGLERNDRPFFREPCLGVGIIISIAPGVQLENFQIITDDFHVNLTSESDVAILNTTEIVLHRGGSLSSDHFDSRRTIVDAGNGAVKGSFALRDLLSITTLSGMIDVSVDPQNNSQAYPAPAESVFRSVDGAITVAFPSSDSLEAASVPDRDFRTTVESTSGAIRGSFLHGSSTKIQSSSGSIEASIQPLHADSDTSTIETKTESSRIGIRVSESLYEPQIPIRHLSSFHQSGSGSIKLEYPKVWEGKIRGTTGSGKAVLEGKDVQVLSKSNRKVLAMKGYGKSELGFQSSSGRVYARVGER